MLVGQPARSGSWPERRSAVVATAAFLGRGQTDDASALARLLVGEDQPLVHEGVGWMLRHAGDVDRNRFSPLLDASAPDLPRAVVHPAVEELEPADRSRSVAASR